MKSLASTQVAHLEHLTAGLADPTDLDVAIHATRKGIKRLRAFLRLARQSIGTSTYRTENGALGHTARLLAPARDAYVLIETAGELGATDRILAELSEDHTRAIAALETGSRIEAVHRLETVIGRWRLLEWHGPDSLSIGAGLGRTYGRGLVDLGTVRTTQASTGFHSWRRRVKYLRYQLEALDAPNKFLGPYTLLGDDLGFEHDQTVLLGVCELHTNDETFASLAHRSLERREELRASAINRGAPLFDQEPESFRRTVEEMIGLHWVAE
jgi:CHAD domain-containing protein